MHTRRRPEPGTAARSEEVPVNKTTSNKLSRRWRKPAAFLAALGAALATFTLTSTAAMASIPAMGGSPDGPKGQETFPPKVVYVPVGTAGWEVTLIAAGSAVVAAALAVLAYRFWTARRLASIAIDLA
jgi:hypothetical protein